jgi:signal transduction histidine kinase
MKLAAHYNRTNIVITVTLFIIGAVIYFFAINYIARKQLDRDLSEEVEEVVDYVSTNHKLPKQVDFDEDQTVFIKTVQKDIQPRFFDTIYVNPKEKENEPGRAVETIIQVNGSYYGVIITVSRESTEYLLQFIGIITLGLMVGLLLILFLANRYFLNGLWKPFYDLLHQIKGFNISEEKNFQLANKRVDEFVELSTAVNSMSARVRSDYQNLKHFTDNASHEMLTPLAVITSKLDTLIQHERLPPEIYEQIEDIYAATGKLSRLNQTLLLLTKIENKLIDDNEPIEMGTLIAEKVKQFQELISAKHINLAESLYEKNIIVSKYLIDILLNNLMSNAIRHNIDYGEMLIAMDQGRLVFQNTGLPIPLNEENIFERFKKGNKSEGTGLGLTLVKNICNLYDWEISYGYKDGWHIFQITF